MHDVVEDYYSTFSASKYLTCFYPRQWCVWRNPIVDKLAAVNYCYDCITRVGIEKKKNKRKKKGKIIKQKWGKNTTIVCSMCYAFTFVVVVTTHDRTFSIRWKKCNRPLCSSFFIIFVFSVIILSNNVCVIPQSALIIANAVIPAWKAKASH